MIFKYYSTNVQSKKKKKCAISLLKVLIDFIFVTSINYFVFNLKYKYIIILCLNNKNILCMIYLCILAFVCT